MLSNVINPPVTPFHIPLNVIGLLFDSSSPRNLGMNLGSVTVTLR